MIKILISILYSAIHDHLNPESLFLPGLVLHKLLNTFKATGVNYFLL